MEELKYEFVNINLNDHNSVILVHYKILKKKWKSLESPNSTPGGDKDKRPLGFLLEI